MTDYYRAGLNKLDLKEPPKGGPAILLYDLETAPANAWDWSAYRSNVVDVQQPPYVLCFAYKWLNKPGVGFVAINHNPEFEAGGCVLCSNNNDDRWVAERLGALFDRADITIAHNGDKFDKRKANSMFLAHDLTPPSPYQTIDTLKESKRYFAEFKHNLDYVTRHHGLGGKEPNTGFELWYRCMVGDPKAWRDMEKYNRRDVMQLEKWYLKIRPWIGEPGKKHHPNLAFWGEDGILTCPKCLSTKVWKRGYHRTTVSEFQTVQCQNCGGYSRARARVSQRRPNPDSPRVGAL